MSAALAELKQMRKAKKASKKDFMQGGGLVYVLDDLELAFSAGLLNEITILYQGGYSVFEIADAIERDPDEVFLALFHQARAGKTTRKFEYRKASRNTHEVKVLKVKKNVPTVIEIGGKRYVYEPQTQWKG